VNASVQLREQEVRDKLRTWIARHTKKGLPANFDDGTAVLELGILSSLDVVEFVLFIEDLRGQEVDPDRIGPEAFASIDTIYSAFFAGS
jgi:acyl carrier protein